MDADVFDAGPTKFFVPDVHVIHGKRSMPELTDIVVNYFKQGYRFRETPPSAVADIRDVPAVFLIHGWGVRAVSMEKLARALAASGFVAFNYDYPTSARNIGEHSRIFLELYRRTLRSENIARKVYFLTHSMGGLLLRAAMAMMSEAECRNIGAVVMLGPPNRGSALARFGKNGLVRSFNASQGDMTPDRDSYVLGIPAPPFLPPVGIIAGRFDGKVALCNTLLPGGMKCCRTVVGCTYPGLRDPRNTLPEIMRFSREKTFDPSDADGRGRKTPLQSRETL